MRLKFNAFIVITLVWLTCANAWAQRIQFPQPNNGLRPIDVGQLPSSGTPAMVPINPATQSGVYPSVGLGSPVFDPYANSNAYAGAGYSGGNVGIMPPAALTGNVYGAPAYGAPSYGANGLGTQAYGTPANGNYPAYTGTPQGIPGVGQSAVIGSYPNTAPSYGQPGVFPNNSPAALYPAAPGSMNNSGSLFGGFFSNMYNGVFGGTSGNYGGTAPPNYNGGVYPPSYDSSGLSAWNPQGTVFAGNGQYPQFIRLFQGIRFRHAFINGNNDADALMINDSDLAAAFAIPSFLFSTQPLYLMPSFSLHQWDGPKPNSTADLPAIAYSAFLDSGWQSDPARIFGAELGLRVGMFSDFETANSDSLRIMGRGIGRIRITPRATVKLGVMYLDRNKVKLLPAGGILWQPNPETRFDLFFPEPKLSHYVSTIGNTDAWWYVGGYYGGGAWTVTRKDKTTDSIDINDLRLVLGLEWGRNDQMREGRRNGFLEVGYVFDRELLFKLTPADNLSLQDTIMVRAGIGY